MKILSIFFLIIFIFSCSSKPDVKDFPKSANAREEITNLEASIENSRDANYQLIAPDSFEQAQNYLKSAKDKLDDKASNEKILKDVAYGKAYLDQAAGNAAKNEKKFQDVLAARNTAMTARADALLPKDLAKLDDKLKETALNLEKGKDKNLKDEKTALIAGYYGLELSAINKNYLGESRNLIDKSIKNGARELTPKTLAEANKYYSEAETIINKDRHNDLAIEAQASVAYESAKKLDQTLTTARGLASSSPEEAAIKLQQDQLQLNLTKEALESEKNTNATLSVNYNQLEQDKKLNSIYEQARSEFSPDEAEVYKQGQNLVIRLRSLQFPKSQAVLKGEDFALLKKVENVIDSFDKTAVKVEGHTDSTGGKALNQKLSDERARAVKQYLEANSNSITDIDSQGFGFEKPLASNKTPEGRAQNRRVDVVITPEQL